MENGVPTGEEQGPEDSPLDLDKVDSIIDQIGELLEESQCTGDEVRWILALALLTYMDQTEGEEGFGEVKELLAHTKVRLREAAKIYPMLPSAGGDEEPADIPEEPEGENDDLTE